MIETLMDSFDIPVGLCIVRGELHRSRTRTVGRRFVVRGAKDRVLFDSKDHIDIANASAAFQEWLTVFKGES